MEEKEKLTELSKLALERRKKSEEVAALDRKIEELLGIAQGSSYKQPSKTLSAKSLREACGVR